MGENQLQPSGQTGTHISSQCLQMILQEKLVPSVLVLNTQLAQESEKRRPGKVDHL